MRLCTLLLVAGTLSACAAPGRPGAVDDSARRAQERAEARERNLARECRLARAERREDPRCVSGRSLGSRNPNQTGLPVDVPVTLPGRLP